MNEHLIWWLLGFLPGGLVGGYLVGRMCCKEYKQRINDLEKENNQLVSDRRKEAKKSLEERTKAAEEAEERIDTILHDDFDFNDPFAEDKKDEDEPHQDDIYVISDEEFKDDIGFRDSETITYYKDDGLLIDSTGQPIHSAEKVVGFEGLKELEMSDKEFIYVSNDYEDKMYEIIVERNQSFYRDIAGAELV